MKVEVRVFRDHMELVGPNRAHTITPVKRYSGARILVGSFYPAVKCLRDGLKEVGALRKFKLKPHLLIRPMEMNEGGLSEVEERVLLEMGHAAGGKRVTLT